MLYVIVMANAKPSTFLNDELAFSIHMTYQFMFNMQPPDFPVLTDASIFILDMVFVDLVPGIVNVHFTVLTIQLATGPPTSHISLAIANRL
jgi:hypothetical protein